jgi:hypothetical protein
MLHAESIVVQPLPLVAVGISPKSFGYYYFNRRESEGVDFLKNTARDDELDPVRGEIVPGSDMNTSWLVAMESVRRNSPGGERLVVRHDLYRFLQFRWAFLNQGAALFFLTLLRNARWRELLFWAGLRIITWFKRVVLRQQVDVAMRLDAFHAPYPRVWIHVADVPQQHIVEFSRQFSPESFLEQYLAARSKRRAPTP